MGTALAPSWVPPFNTSLIVVSGAFLVLGLFFIRRKQVALHGASMLDATTFAAQIRVVYVGRYWLYAPKHADGSRPIRAFYFVVLGTHIILAVLQVPLVLYTLSLALRAEWPRHRRFARITAPIWLYVVVTGWIVYGLLYMRS